MNALEDLLRKLSTLVKPPQPSAPVGGCLQVHLPVWKSLTVSPTVLQILQEGYILPLRHNPPLVMEPPHMHCTRLPELREQIAVLQQKGAIEPADLRYPGFYSRIFVVPKATGGYRPVIDLLLLKVSDLAKKLKF